MATSQQESTVTQVSAQPTAKVAAAGIGGAVTILVVYVAGLFGVHLPAEVASALTAIIGFASGYLVKDRVITE